MYILASCCFKNWYFLEIVTQTQYMLKPNLFNVDSTIEILELYRLPSLRYDKKSSQFAMWHSTRI